MLPIAPLAAILVCLASTSLAAADSRSVHLLQIQGQYLDHPLQQGVSPIALLQGVVPQPERSLFELLAELRRLVADPSLDGVFLDLSSTFLQMTPGQIDAVADACTAIRASGKTIIALIDDAGPLHYELALNADHILMPTMGDLDVPSPLLVSLHFKKLFDQLGIAVDAVRAGDFKGAIEPFQLTELSAHQRQHYTDLLHDRNGRLVDRIAQRRKVEIDRVRGWQKQRLFTAAEALAAGLIDSVIPYGEQYQMAQKILGAPISWRYSRPKQAASFDAWALLRHLLKQGQAPAASQVLAVLHLRGPILAGIRLRPDRIASRATAQAIKKLRNDPRVQAVLVRVDSPGGSASASEEVRQALENLAAAKPVVVSFGGVAASGGYWLSCCGAPMVAEADSITGSIGVFGLKLSAGALLDRVGLTVDVVSLDPAAGAMLPHRRWSDAEAARLQELIDAVYQRFLHIVAGQRPLSLAELQELAGGRIFTGSQAAANGLVDRVASLTQALAMLRQQAGISVDLPIEHHPRLPHPLLEMLQMASGEEASLGSAALPLLSQLQQDLQLPNSLLPLLEALLQSRGQSVTWAVLPHLLRW